MSTSEPRLTVVEKIYHQASLQEDPFHLRDTYTQLLTGETEEDPYQRTYKIHKTAEVELDVGWLKDQVGMVHIRNKGTEENQTLFLGFTLGVRVIAIPPDCSVRIYPLGTLVLSTGPDFSSTFITVTVFPK